MNEGRSFTFPEEAAVPNYWLSLLCLLLIKAVLMLYFIVYGTIGLGPDEAQYWTWSKQLDWGYYSKPPGIAWLIALSTYYFGDTELGVRFEALVIAFLLPYGVYALARAVGLKCATAFWAGVIMAFSPLGIVSSFLATTDAPYVLLWTIALALLLNDVQKARRPRYGLIGLAVLLGALFKWTIYLFWLAAFLIAWARPHYRSIGRMGAGIALSLVGLVPSLIWNSAHDFATFRHVWQTNVIGQSERFFHGNFFAFFGAQAAFLSPVFFVLLILAFYTLWVDREKIDPSLFWCAAISAIILATYLTLSIFKKMQGNWCVYAYPSCIVLISWYACEHLHRGKPWLFAGVVTSVFLTALTFALPGYQASVKKPWFPIPFSCNPFKSNIGYKQMEKDLKLIAFNSNRQFLFASRYGMSSLLSFYNEDKARAYFFNLENQRKNQFSYWPSMADQEEGQTGFYVTIEQKKELEGDLAARVAHYEDLLKPYFEQVHFLGRYPLFHAYDRVVKTALIYQCVEYNGKQPPEIDKY